MAARVLIIDDSLTDVEILRYALDSLGDPYELEILTDGAAALQFVREHRSGVRPPEPCVILLDLNLPKYSGLAVLQAIKETPALTHIYVIALTGGASPAQRAEIEKQGALFRQKPMQLSDYIALGREVLALCNDQNVPVGQ